MVNASRDPAQTGPESVTREIQQLPRLTIAALQSKYRELYGEEPTVLHKQSLVRRIGWQLQVEAEGDLSERARRRIAEIADVADLRVRTPPGLLAGPQPAAPVSLNGSLRGRDPRLPPAGTLVRRHYQGREIVVKVREKGFEYDSQSYRSLSAIARTVTGTRWNGLLFFGLTERRTYV